MTWQILTRRKTMDTDENSEVMTSYHLEFVDVGYNHTDIFLHIGESVSIVDAENNFITKPVWNARMTMAPGTAKELAITLTGLIEAFEAQYGQIPTAKPEE